MTPWINIWAKFFVVLFSRVGYSHENYMNSHSYRHMFFLLLGCWQAVLKVLWFSSGDVVVHSTCVKRKVQVLSVQFTFLLCLMCWEVCSSVEADISTNAFSKVGRFYWSNHKMQVWVGDVFASVLNKCGLTITSAFCFLYEKAQTFDKNCQRQHAFYSHGEIVSQPMCTPTLLLRAQACGAHFEITNIRTAWESFWRNYYEWNAAWARTRKEENQVLA